MNEHRHSRNHPEWKNHGEPQHTEYQRESRPRYHEEYYRRSRYHDEYYRRSRSPRHERTHRHEREYDKQPTTTSASTPYNRSISPSPSTQNQPSSSSSNTTKLFDELAIRQTIKAAKTGINKELPADYVAKIGQNLTYIQSTRPSRRLFVGNLPSHLPLNEYVIAQFFKTYMQVYNFKTPEPILTASISESLTYVFITIYTYFYIYI